MKVDDLQPQRRMFLRLLPKRPLPHRPTPEERSEYPEPSANILSRIFFTWMHPILDTGYRRTLVPEDLFTLTPSLQSKEMGTKFEEIFGSEIAKRDAAREKKPLKDGEKEGYKWITTLAAIKTFKLQFGISCLILTITQCASACTPLLTKKMIQVAENRKDNTGPAVGYVIGTVLVVFIIGVLVNQFTYLSTMTGARVRAALTKAVMEKSFRINQELKHKFPNAKITSILTVDLSRIDAAFMFLPYLFTFPFSLAVLIAILIVNIGVLGLVGVGVLFAFVAFVSWAIVKVFEWRTLINALTDSRVKLMKEVLNNLKTIKLYAWEPPYKENLRNVRGDEMSMILRIRVLIDFVSSISISLPLLSSMTAFLVLYKLSDAKGITRVASVFSSVSIFNTLASQVNMLPAALYSLVDAAVAMGRVGEFLVAPEIQDVITQNDSDLTLTEDIEKDLLSNVAISVKDAYFEWEFFDLSESPDDANETINEKTLTVVRETTTSVSDTDSLTSKKVFALKDIDFSIMQGEFVVITGVIGSGKSSLLSALAGFMPCLLGSVRINGSSIFCSQPWIQNATVRENIIFGEAYDPEKYRRVLYACALEDDMKVLPAGDNTEVGERGITLSGGQKARINLARAVYANKLVILLDDVLSAVDAKVGKHIVDNCLLGLMGSQTRILATHQLSLVESADRVIFLNGDGSITMDTFQGLMSSSPAFASLMAYGIQKDKNTKANSQSTKQEEPQKKDDTEQGNGKLISEETKAVNSISLSVFVDYFKAVSDSNPMLVLWLLLIILLATLTTFCQLFTTTWLSFWTEQKFKKTNGFYIGLYIMFTALSLLFLLAQSVTVTYLANTSLRRLNLKSMDRILQAPMLFMDTTPMGRVINRFTKDTNVLDNMIGDQLAFLLYLFSSVAGVIILCIIYIPWFAISVPFSAFLFVAVANYSQALSRELKRLESVERSFVFNNFDEILTGMDTIKAYNHKDRFMAKSDYLVDQMNEAYFLNNGAQRWLTVMLEITAGIITLVVSMLCVLGVFHLSPASVGLLLSYVFEISSQLSQLLRLWTQIENDMNSVERVVEYGKIIPQEKPHEITETTPPPLWPQGQITFDNCSLRYRPELPMVLKNLSFSVKKGEKVGICGRTGAGKSTIMSSLFRLTELNSGTILIDGIDISTLGLRQLRSKLAIIPQDPVLFRGSIRKNLDPFNESSDDKLLDALQRTGLHFKLTQMVDDDGLNFSLGERQLIAFARALVRDSLILILDEATSSVDYETDLKIQATIAREFAHCTILCIAHRMKTIINYDKILVLEQGEKLEFGAPLELYREDLVFRQLCLNSKITEQDFAVREIA